jgi:hypothetical protein
MDLTDWGEFTHLSYLRGFLVERRTAVFAVNGRKSSPIRSFLRRHPMIRMILWVAVLALVGALINWLISYIPGNVSGSNPIPPVPVPPDTSQSLNSSSLPSPPSPMPTTTQARSTTQQARHFSIGSCLAGDFTKSSPADVRRVPCSSAEAQYRIIKEFPGATDPSVCRDVPGVKLGYLEEYTENGIPVESRVYCLG